MDKENKIIPQFIDKKGNAQEDFKEGYSLDKQGRLQRVIDLARQDIIMHDCSTYDGSKNEKDYQKELDEQLMLKLFEIDTVDKVMQGAKEKGRARGAAPGGTSRCGRTSTRCVSMRRPAFPIPPAIPG